MKKRFSSFAAACLSLCAVALSGCGEEPPAPYRVNLEVWGTFDDTGAYASALSGYQSLNPSHIEQITYRKLPIETYKEDLLRAFAEGRGPDIFMIRNSWLPAFSEMVAPAPEYQTNEKEYRDAFVDVAARDFVVDGRVYGVPLSVDSLALYYNKDLFNSAGITNPPTTWEMLAADAGLLTRIDEYGNITQPGVALGTAANINRSMDILLALGSQYGSSTKPNGFSDGRIFSDQPMVNALDSYSRFSKLGSDRYSWNLRQHWSLDAFSEGNLGMMINYSWHADTLRRKNAKLNFGVAPLPQLSAAKPSNYANYWSLVVAKNKLPPEEGSGATSYPAGKYNDLRIHESWQFLYYLAFPHPDDAITLRNPISQTSATLPMPDDPAKKYLEETRKPAARRDLIEAQKGDVWLAPFAYGNLIADSLRSMNIEKTEGILANAIESVVLGQQSPIGALEIANAQIQLIERKK